MHNNHDGTDAVAVHRAVSAKRERHTSSAVSPGRFIRRTGAPAHNLRDQVRNLRMAVSDLQVQVSDLTVAFEHR